MAGFAIDKNPVPDQTLGFELPDSDARIYSCGLRYQPTDNLTIGAAYLFDDKESRTVPTNANSITALSITPQPILSPPGCNTASNVT